MSTTNGTANGRGSGTGKTAGENGKRLPISRKRTVAVEDLKDLTDKELIALANKHHRRFCGRLRDAVAEDARIVGAALIQEKARLKHGSWGGWLKENFEGSEETARLYIRVAKHWHLIEEQALDQKGLTLEELRWVISESSGERPGSKTKNKKGADTKDTGDEPDGEPHEEDNPSPSHTRQIQLLFDEDDAEEFEEWVRRLGVEYKTDNTTDTVREAVRREHDAVTEEVANG
jgi:hypothetical protein